MFFDVCCLSFRHLNSVISAWVADWVAGLPGLALLALLNGWLLRVAGWLVGGLPGRWLDL